MRRRRWSFNDVVNCLSLAHKYQIEDVLEDSRAELKRYFPNNLAAWKTRCTYGPDSNAIVAVNVARRTNTLSVLPAALYACCQLPVDYLLGDDDSQGAPAKLFQPDLVRCFEARRRLCAEHIRAFEVDMCSTLPDNRACKSPESCSGVLSSARSEFRPQVLGPWFGDVLNFPWHQFFAQLYYGTTNAFLGRSDPLRIGLCGSCAKRMQNRERMLTESLWTKLPSLLGLGDWSRLRDDPTSEGSATSDDA